MARTEKERYRSFPETRWTLVSLAGKSQTVRSLKALNELLTQYLPALKTHLTRHLKLSPERADDLLQSFVTEKILVKDLLKRVHRGKGRFRSFLLKTFNNFLVSEIRKEKAQKRAPNAPTNVSLSEYEDYLAVEPDTDAGLNTVWAQQLIAQALDRMHAMCESRGRLDIWGVFEGRILEPILSNADPVPYENLADEFGFASPLKAANALTTAKRGFRQALSKVVADTVADDAQIDAEISSLMEILSGFHAESPHPLRGTG